MAILLFLIGCIFGSFFLVIGTRLPKGEDVIFSRSRCDSCGKELKWYNLIPLFSFIFQRGKCSFCHQKISSEHFWVELATGLLFMMTYFYFSDYCNFFIGLVLVSLMIVIFVSDFKYMVILDSSLIISSLLIIIIKLIFVGVKVTLFSICSGIILFLVMLMVQMIGTFLLKKESLGGGDIKLAFVIGLSLNMELGITAIVLSTFLALPYALACLYFKKDHQFPYGPFLAGALFIVFYHYDKFVMLLDFLFPF